MFKLKLYLSVFLECSRKKRKEKILLIGKISNWEESILFLEEDNTSRQNIEINKV